GSAVAALQASAAAFPLVRPAPQSQISRVSWTSSLPFAPVADLRLSECPQTPFPTTGVATIPLQLFFSFPLSLTASRSSFLLLLRFQSMDTPVSLRAFSHVNLEAASYWHVNRL